MVNVVDRHIHGRPGPLLVGNRDDFFRRQNTPPILSLISQIHFGDATDESARDSLCIGSGEGNTKEDANYSSDDGNSRLRVGKPDLVRYGVERNGLAIGRVMRPPL